MSDPPGPQQPPPPPPPPPGPHPSGQYQPPPGTYQPPAGPQPYFTPGSPGYMPPPITATAGGAGLLSQFGGRAMWSIIAGLVSIIVPFFTTFYFPILPIIGLLYGVQAIRRGQLIGGIIGLVLSVLGGIVSFLASPLGPH